MSSTGLAITRLSVRRGSRTVLQPLSLALEPGTVTALVGPNGAGKSTLLEATAGLLSHEGSVWLNGAALAPGDLGYLPQSNAIHSGLTVLETVLLGIHDRLGWRVHAAALEAARRTIGVFRLDDLAHRPMDTLSGGQQQMALLAQRLVKSPRVLLLDEPTSALDLHHQLGLFAVLRDYAQQQKAIIVAAIHDLSLAAQHCDHVALLCEGRLEGYGKPQDTLTANAIRSAYRVDVEILCNSKGQRAILPLSPVVDQATTAPAI